MAPPWPRSLGCKSATDVAHDVHRPSLTCKSANDVADGVHRPSLCCHSSDVKGSLTIVPARKIKKPAATPPDTESSRPFLAITDLPDAHSPWPFLPMHELPEGHSSRRTVEIIFVSGWTGYAASIASAEVEAVFDVDATPRADAAFEEARAAARARAALDGKEMMRFQCRNVECATGDVVCAAVATCRFCPAGVDVDSAVRTFDGSGAAHARVGGSAEGRRVMLLCRVIAGRVRHANDPEIAAAGDGEYDSVEMDGGDELVVLDSRGVLPRYLVVYKVKPRPALEMSDSDEKACTLDQLVEYADAVTYA